MFSKVYRQKSNNTLKNSEKKHLVQRILEEFSGASEQNVSNLMPLKSNTTCMKLLTHSDKIVSVFVVDGLPAVIDIDGRLLPTLYSLWNVLNLVPTITIHTPVLPKVQGGAPLYIPGVVIPREGKGFPQFERNAVIALNTENNTAAAVVGIALMSSVEMLYTTSGICFETIHILGDLLCKDQKFSKLERPKLDPPHNNTDDTALLTTNIDQITINEVLPLKEEWPTLNHKIENFNHHVDNEPRMILETENTVLKDSPPDNAFDIEELNETDHKDVDEEVPTDMDELLKFCLLSFIKLEGKKIELPLKTNLLYRNHLLPLCPPERSLDVKKSTFKKMSKFLDAMQKEGLVDVKEIEKGVDALVGLDVNHGSVRGHRIPLSVIELKDQQTTEEIEYKPPTISELYAVTANVVNLFTPLKKGSMLSAVDVRKTVTEYVKRHGMASGGCVRLDSTLAKATGRSEQDELRWEELMCMVLGRMTSCTQMVFPDGTVRTSRTTLEPIKMQIATRSGNKKVTLVSNLELYGFNLNALSHECQVGVAASCGVTKSPGAKSDQLLLQGDQSYYVAKLLIEKYGLPKKYVDGADKALKKKK